MFFQNAYGWTHIWMEVLEALAVTFAVVIIIYFLDKLADSKCTGEKVDECIRDSVLAFGVLIGFCWEHAFDLGVVAMAVRWEHHAEVMQLVMCLGIALIVCPAYIWYIVPIQFEQEKLHQEREEEEKKLKAEMANHHN
jgi:hypothetical protein